MTAALASILVSWIAGTPQPRPRFDMGIRATRVADNLYVLDGAGGNVIAFMSDEGVLLVDDKLPAASPDLKAALGTITSKPIRFVVNTHWHRDHAGGNQALAGQGSVIVAHENTRRRMSVDSFVGVFNLTSPAAPPAALPIVTFTRDVTLHLGGEDVSVVHVDPAHTDGDSLVFFRNANLLHMGDVYLNGSYPVIDYSSGGTFTGLIAAADRALGMLDGSSRIVPGHGPIATVKDLRQWREMLATILERVKASVAAGRTLDQIKAERPARDWDGRFPQSFVSADHVIEEAYRSVVPR